MRILGIGMIACAILAPKFASGQSLKPTPPELMLVFDSYTKKLGLDKDACTFPLWDANLLGQTPKKMMSNAFVSCPLKSGTQICTAIAAEVVAKFPVENGCITGFDTVNFLPVAAISTKGGFFVVVFGAKGQPLRFADQLTLGFGPERDYCELSAFVIDQNAVRVAGKSFHDFVDLLADDKLCRR